MSNIVLKLLTGSNKYAGNIAYFGKKLSEQNSDFISMLHSVGITRLSMTTLGNSIATGYSFSDIIKPLLLRNKTLQSMLNGSSISSDFYNFTRAQDNNEERILEYISSNIKQSEINRRNQIDLNGGLNSMERSGITDNELVQYFPLEPKKDKGLKDIILENAPDLANILVYSGCTGSFLDNVTRKGQHFNLYGFKRDLIGLESVLKWVYINSPNTQIFVSGIPNLLNINIVYVINRHIKAMCDRYSNASYVPPAPAHMLYDKNGKLVIDIHHNQGEYLNLNSNIMNTINNHFIQNMFYISIDIFLSDLSNRNQFETPQQRDNPTLVEEGIDMLIAKFSPLLEKQSKNIDEVMKQFIEYYKERYPHDYFYTPKKETIETFKNKR